MSPREQPGDYYSLPGLLALYEYEPSLRDVYGEGRTDAGLLTWYLQECGFMAPAVFAIDDRVDISAEDISSSGLDLEINARGRAVALAAICERELGPSQRGVTVVVDADFAQFTGLPKLSCLLVTDEPAMEGYALAERPLEKLLRVSLHQPKHITPQVVRAAILPALNDIFAVRLTLHRVAVACIGDIAAVCTLSDKGSAADMRELVRRSLTGIRKSEWPKSIDELAAEAEGARKELGEAGHTGRGHDIAIMLIAFLGLKGIAANRDSLEMAMRTCFEVGDLDGQPMFEKLKGRVAA